MNDGFPRRTAKKRQAQVCLTRACPWGANSRSVDLDEDALAGALLGGLDHGLFHATGNHGEPVGAARVAEDLVAFLDVGQAVVEEGEDRGAISSQRPSPVQRS